MYFKEKEDTNLDKEFKSNKKFNINPKYILIILGGIILLVAIIFLIKFITKSDKYFIELLGDENITLYQGNEYVEPGYRGYDQKNNDLTDDVLVENKLDINTIGEYSITYSLKGTEITRNIKIVAKPDTATYIYLYGKTTMYLDVGEEYVEPKCIVFNSSGTDLNNKVKITNNIDNKVAGTYQVIYSVTNEDGISVTAIRIVIVMDSEVTYKLSPNGYTNGSVTINLEILDPYYKYMILPDGNKVTSKTHQYQVSQNGTYKIETYNTKDTKKETNIKIDTIDTQNPSGSCSGYYKDGVSYINVSASDNTGISKYVLNNQTFTSNNIKYSSELNTASITVYDNANNQIIVNCSLDNKNINNNPSSNPSSNSSQDDELPPSDNNDQTSYPEKEPVKISNGKLTLNYYNSSSRPFAYWLYTPKTVTSNLPVIVFLAGIGERGNDYSKGATLNLSNGFGNEIKDYGYSYNAIIIMPQVPANQSVSDYSENIMKLTSQIVSKYSANKKKISIMGFSHGCYGLLNYVTRYPNTYSAAVAIGCTCDSKFVNSFKTTPLWTIVGGGDGETTMESFAQKVNAAGGSAKHTYAPKKIHNILGDTYSILRDKNYDVADWMLSKSR